MSKLPLAPGEILGVVKEIRTQAKEDRPLVVAGARELSEALKRELTKGGVESAVQGEASLDRAAALVYVFAGAPTQDDLAVLKRAARAHTPIVGVVAAPRGEHVVDPPYVLAEHVVTAQPGSGFPMDAIARALAHALNEHATPIAARLPVLRDAVVDRIITRFARQNGVIGVSIFVPGADMPVLTVNQIRMLMRIADAYGFEFDKERIPEVLGVIGSGYGFRTVARSLLGVIPIAGWAVKGGIAYGGTRALGEAARRYFESKAPVTKVAGDRAVFPR